MYKCFILLLISFLLSCQSGTGGYISSGRSIEEINLNIKSGNYPKDSSLIKEVARNYCDCLSILNLPKNIKKGKAFLEDEATFAESGEVIGMSLMFLACKNIGDPYQYEGLYPSDRNRIAAEAKVLCPVLVDYATTFDQLGKD